jgi:ribose 5-phosphate isomerase A
VGGIEAQKRAAAGAALGEVESGMLLGLGTGTTVRYFLDGLDEALKAGALRGVRGVPTSADTERRCLALGIPTVDLADGLTLDLAVDGADEVSPGLDLIKGLGGALLREKMVAQASRRFVVIVDAAKEVEHLGERAPVPVEVARFGWSAHLSHFRSLGAEPRARERPDGGLVVTDNGNHLIDLAFPEGILAPTELESALRRRAGVLETGLFLGMADRVFVGRDEEVAVREKAGA